MLVVTHTLVPTIQKTVEVPQFQCSDRIAVVPTVWHHQVSVIAKAQKTVQVPQAQFQVVEVLVEMQPKAPLTQKVPETVETPRLTDLLM